MDKSDWKVIKQGAEAVKNLYLYSLHGMLLRENNTIPYTILENLPSRFLWPQDYSKGALSESISSPYIGYEAEPAPHGPGSAVSSPMPSKWHWYPHSLLSWYERAHDLWRIRWWDDNSWYIVSKRKLDRKPRRQVQKPCFCRKLEFRARPIKCE